jgi:hypothetical protein
MKHPSQIVRDMTGKNYLGAPISTARIIATNPKLRKQYEDQQKYDAEENRLSSAFPRYPAMTTKDKYSIPTRYAKPIIEANERQKAKWWSLKK